MITQLDKQTALVLIDMQQGIARPDTVHPLEEIILKQIQLVAAFHEKKLPVVFVTVNPVGARWTKSRMEMPTVPINPFIDEQTGEAMPFEGFTELIPELEVLPQDLQIRKHTWNAFFETPLHEELQKRGITQIVLAGISTSIGVEGTARAASELGYNIAFAMDAMTDRNLQAHEVSIKIIFPRMGERGTSAELIAILQKMN